MSHTVFILSQPLSRGKKWKNNSGRECLSCALSVITLVGEKKVSFLSRLPKETIEEKPNSLTCSNTARKGAERLYLLQQKGSGLEQKL